MNSNNLYINKKLLYQLNQKQEEIGEYLLNCDLDYTNDVGIMSGLAGVGLTLSLYYRNTSDERFLDKLEQTIELINKKIKAGNDIVSSYAHGIAGYAWLIIYLKENNIIEVDLNDYFFEMDDFLYCQLMLMLEAKQYDSLHKAIGIGYYFLKRGKNEVIEQIINELYNNRKTINGYATWTRYDQKNYKDVIDLGFAHGIPGKLFFLFKCYLKQISTKKCGEMIRENVAFIISFMNLSGTPSYLPYNIEIDQIKKFNSKSNWSRLAWCYGDLSALYVLQLLPSFLPAQLNVNDMLEHVAERRDAAATDANITGICHGSSGVAHIFFRMFLKTGNHCFEEACHYWLKKTLSLGNEPTGIIGHVFPENYNSQPLDLLIGISGISTVILSFLNPDLISWDESIFLS